MGDLVGLAALLHRGGAVAAADDGHGAGIRNGLGHLPGAIRKSRELKYAHRPVPHDGAGALHSLAIQLYGLRADVHTHEVLGDILACLNGGGVLRELGSADAVYRQEQLHALGRGLVHHFLRVLDPVGLEQALADGVALGHLEGVGHAAADNDGVGLLEQVVDYADLVADLRAAQDGHEGPRGVGQGLAHDGDLFLHQESRIRRQESRNAGGGGVGAVHGAEGIGHVHVRHLRQLLREVGAILLLTLVKAQVLEQQQLARLQGRGLGLGVLADNVLCKNNFHPEQLGKPLGHGSQSQALLPLALGLAKVRAGDNGGAVLEQVLDGRQSGDYALVARDLAGLLVLGHIKIAAQEHLLAMGIEVPDRLLVVVHSDSSCFILP